jgi:hypothetical protein
LPLAVTLVSVSRLMMPVLARPFLAERLVRRAERLVRVGERAPR